MKPKVNAHRHSDGKQGEQELPQGEPKEQALLIVTDLLVDAYLQNITYLSRQKGFDCFFPMCDLSMRHVCFLPKGIILYRSMSAICIKGNAGSNSRTSSKDRVQCRSHLGPLPGKDIPRRI